MPGIVGILGAEANLVTLQNMCHVLCHNTYLIDSYHEPESSLARIHLGYVSKQPQPVISANKQYICVLIGEIFEYEGISGNQIEDDATFFLKLFVNKGKAVLSQINGQFAACIYDCQRKISYLISDRYGSWPVYYTIHNGSLLFAPEVKSLLACGIPKKINYTAFSDSFHFGHLMGYKTLFQDVHQLPDATCLTFHNGNIEKEIYWDFPFIEEAYREQKFPEKMFREMKEELKYVMRNAVSRQVKKNMDKLLIPLSGGLDSRFIAALTKDLVTYPANTLTMGGPTSEDQIYGSQVARKLQYPHKAYDISPFSIWDSALFFSYISDNMSDITGPIQIHQPCIDFYGKDEVLLAPQMCDALFGSTLKRKSVKAIRKYPEKKMMDSILVNMFNLISESNLQLVFDPGFYQRYIKDAWTQVPKQYINQYEHPLHCYFMLLIKEHVRRFTLSGNLIYNLYYNTRMPSYDNDLIDLSFHIPLSFKNNQNIYRFAFSELFPELASIKRQGTHLSIGASDFLVNTHHFMDKVLIKTKSLPVIESIANKFIPPSYISHNRWFKFELRTQLQSLLLEKRTLERGIFTKKGIETLLKMHDSTTEDHSRLLWQMVNLEYFFRNFID